MVTLQSTSEVVEALGGVGAAARLLAVSPKAVRHWKTTKKFPPHSYMAIIHELGRKGLMAEVSLWSFTEACKLDAAAVDPEQTPAALAAASPPAQRIEAAE